MSIFLVIVFLLVTNALTFFSPRVYKSVTDKRARTAQVDKISKEMPSLEDDWQKNFDDYMDWAEQKRLGLYGDNYTMYTTAKADLERAKETLRRAKIQQESRSGYWTPCYEGYRSTCSCPDCQIGESRKIIAESTAKLEPLERLLKVEA